MDKASATFKAGAARPRCSAVVLLAAGLLCAGWSGPARAAPVHAAVFPFELVDTSLRDPTNGGEAADQARLKQLDVQLRAALIGSGRYTLVGTTAVAQAAAARSLWDCDDCTAALARQAGAQVAVNGWVQKVSNLILNINLVIRDAATGRPVRAGSVDIRGDTDESWSRGLAWLLRHRILSEPGSETP
jgi:hypothetical protein